jgi:L-threonylcarbamoyladenylate synthase
MALYFRIDFHNPSDRPLILAAEVMQAGGVVVYPTETLYGIGANAWNPRAVSRVHILKQRKENRPVLVIIRSRDAVLGLTDEISESAVRLMERFWPGPLTLLFRANTNVPSEVTGGTGKIGVRISSSPLCLRLCELCGHPITSTSANRTGQQPLASPLDIEHALGPGVDLYLDGGTLPAQPPSTIVDVSEDHPKVVRLGAISLEGLLQVLPNMKS